VNAQKTGLPQFFAGQWIDYKDFNRLALCALEASEQTFASLVPWGGVIADSQRTQVLSFQKDKIVVAALQAIMPSGRLVSHPAQKILWQELLEKSGAVVHSGQDAFAVVLQGDQAGADFYQDAELVDVKGFKTLLIVPVIKCMRLDSLSEDIHTKLKNANAVEIGRFELESKTQTPGKFYHQYILWMRLPCNPGFLPYQLENLKRLLGQLESKLRAVSMFFSLSAHLDGLGGSQKGIPGINIFDALFVLRLELASLAPDLPRLHLAVQRVCLSFSLFLERCLHQPESVGDDAKTIEVIADHCTKLMRVVSLSETADLSEAFEVLSGTLDLLDQLAGPQVQQDFMGMGIRGLDVRCLMQQLELWEHKWISVSQKQWVIFGHLFSQKMAVDAFGQSGTPLEQEAAFSLSRFARASFGESSSLQLPLLELVAKPQKRAQVSFVLPKLSGTVVVVIPQWVRPHQELVFDAWMNGQKVQTLRLVGSLGGPRWQNAFVVLGKHVLGFPVTKLTLVAAAGKSFGFCGALVFSWEGFEPASNKGATC
jgi:hypothetical protein